MDAVGSVKLPNFKMFFWKDTFYGLLCVPNVMVVLLLQRTTQYKTFELLKFFICRDFYTKFSKENLRYISRRKVRAGTQTPTGVLFGCSKAAVLGGGDFAVGYKRSNQIKTRTVYDRKCRTHIFLSFFGDLGA
jgi:hypothetical protein